MSWHTPVSGPTHLERDRIHVAGAHPSANAGLETRRDCNATAAVTSRVGAPLVLVQGMEKTNKTNHERTATAKLYAVSTIHGGTAMGVVDATEEEIANASEGWAMNYADACALAREAAADLRCKWFDMSTHFEFVNVPGGGPLQPYDEDETDEEGTR